MNKGDIFWTHIKITGYGDRIVPYYFTRQGPDDMVYGIISSGACECAFSKKYVFCTVKEARVATGFDRVWCYEHSSARHHDIVNEIHEDEGLICPTCGPGTTLIELDPATYKSRGGYTHFCLSSRKNIGEKSRQYQVTLSRRAGCASYITLKLKSSSSSQCNCGSPHVDHVPGGSYCWKTLDKKRKYL